MNAELPFRLRVRYRKDGRLRYLGHLEVLRTIERSVRRAGLPYAVTQGFSPHMRIAFSSALPVGTSSSCEWFDLWLTERVAATCALDALARSTPADLAPLQVGYVDIRAPALTTLLTRIRYGINVRLRPGASGSAEAFDSALAAIFASGRIDYMRGDKSRQLDLGRTLAGWRVQPALSGSGWRIELDTRAGNDGSLRPDIVLAAIDERLAPAEDAAAPAAAIATGSRAHAVLAGYDVCRLSQLGADERGDPIAPLPDPAVRAHRGRKLLATCT